MISVVRAEDHSKASWIFSKRCIKGGHKLVWAVRCRQRRPFVPQIFVFRKIAIPLSQLWPLKWWREGRWAWKIYLKMWESDCRTFPCSRVLLISVEWWALRIFVSQSYQINEAIDWNDEWKQSVSQFAFGYTKLQEIIPGRHGRTLRVKLWGCKQPVLHRNTITLNASSTFNVPDESKQKGSKVERGKLPGPFAPCPTEQMKSDEKAVDVLVSTVPWTYWNSLVHCSLFQRVLRTLNFLLFCTQCWILHGCERARTWTCRQYFRVLNRHVRDSSVKGELGMNLSRPEPLLPLGQIRMGSFC